MRAVFRTFIRCTPAFSLLLAVAAAHGEMPVSGQGTLFFQKTFLVFAHRPVEISTFVDCEVPSVFRLPKGDWFYAISLSCRS